MTDKEKRELKDGVISIFKRFNILDQTATIGGLRDDILRYIDSLQEEPVSESIDFEQELYKAFGQIKDFTLGIAIAKRFYDMGRKHNGPVSEDLKKVSDKYSESIESNYLNDMFDRGDIMKAFKAGVKWQKEKDFQYVKKECERTGGCCDNDIAIEAAKRHPYYYASEMEAYANIGFKEGAMWQMSQMMKGATDVTVHIDAGGYPYIPQLELYDYVKDVPLSKKGDKYKVILIKEE